MVKFTHFIYSFSPFVAYNDGVDDITVLIIITLISTIETADNDIARYLSRLFIFATTIFKIYEPPSAELQKV